MSKRKEERKLKIQQIVNERNTIKISQLAKELNITPETLRKDLNELEAQSLLIREHGYARSQSMYVETPISLKSNENKEMKKSITLEAFKRIQDGQIVYLDAGSTILSALSAIQNKKDITIVTNSLLVAYECANMNKNIIMAGGFIFNRGLRTYGHFATELIDHLQIDIAIMGTDTISQKNHGFTTISADELGFKRHVMNQSHYLVMICDASKINNQQILTPYSFCRFHEFDELITNPLSKEQYDIVKDVKKIVQV